LNIYIKLLCTKIEFLRLYTPLWKDLWQTKTIQRSVNKTDNKGNFKKKKKVLGYFKKIENSTIQQTYIWFRLDQGEKEYIYTQWSSVIMGVGGDRK
jgi:hypothetical protein